MLLTVVASVADWANRPKKAVRVPVNLRPFLLKTRSMLERLAEERCGAVDRIGGYLPYDGAIPAKWRL